MNVPDTSIENRVDRKDQQINRDQQHHYIEGNVIKRGPLFFFSPGESGPYDKPDN